MANKVSAKEFAAFIEERIARKDGYIMAATGQNPKKWAKDSWWFTQYTGAQREKALYWREHAERVWDCNGLAEGYYKDQTGTDINSKARTNYASWCSGANGTGVIPPERRVPGAAVFIYDSGKRYITHVAFLLRPVEPDDPAGDWYLGEARSVNYGVVETRLSRRTGFNRWGWMEKYFEYPAFNPPTPDANPYAEPASLIRRNSRGEGVKWVQWELNRLGCDLGRYGIDGKFGAYTERAVRAFQKQAGVKQDGIVGPVTRAALREA